MNPQNSWTKKDLLFYATNILSYLSCNIIMTVDNRYSYIYLKYKQK